MLHNLVFDHSIPTDLCVITIFAHETHQWPIGCIHFENIGWIPVTILMMTFGFQIHFALLTMELLLARMTQKMHFPTIFSHCFGSFTEIAKSRNHWARLFEGFKLLAHSVCHNWWWSRDGNFIIWMLFDVMGYQIVFILVTKYAQLIEKGAGEMHLFVGVFNIESRCDDFFDIRCEAHCLT